MATKKIDPEAESTSKPEPSVEQLQEQLAAKDRDVAILEERCARLELELDRHRQELAKLRPPTPAKERGAGRYKVVGPGSVVVNKQSCPAGTIVELSADEAKSLGAEVEPVRG